MNMMGSVLCKKESKLEKAKGLVEEFLFKWKIHPDCIDIKACCNAFLTAMENGLAGKESSLKMIPTYIELCEEIPAEEPVIVLDAGGTNFRTCIVTFDDSLKPEISAFTKSGMPGVKQEVTSKQFFQLLGDQVEPIINGGNRIGFCFSYAAKITPEKDGILLHFSKEIKAPEVKGQLVGASLLKDLADRGCHVKDKKLVLLNDTVATLLAGKAAAAGKKYSGYIGFILGTGTNTSYVELNKNISEVKDPELHSGKQIINIESGGFDFHSSEFDTMFFNTTKEPDIYHFEKMISGAYLGPFAKLVLTEACKAGLFSDVFNQKFFAIQEFTTIIMDDFLHNPQDPDTTIARCCATELDGYNAYKILDAVIARAAKLTAANLAATVLKSGSGDDPRYPVCINADGTTYYKTHNLKKYTESYVYQFLQEQEKRYVEFVQIQDSPVLGAAIAGLSL